MANDNEFIELISQETKSQADWLEKQLEKGEKAIIRINKQLGNMKVPSDVTRQIKEANRETNRSNALQKESERITRALERQKAKLTYAQKKVNQDLQKYRFETREANKRAKEAAIISSRLSTEYQKVQAQMSRLTRRYQDLATKQATGVKLSKQEEKELEDVTRELRKKDAALKKVDAGMGRYNRNVGNYASAWGGVRSMLFAAAGAFGVYSALDIGKEIFNQVKEIDSLNKALKQVTETTENFNQAQSFIISLSEETGVEINQLQRSYTKFYAAAKNTNLELSETQDIFRQTAKAGAVLGLSTEQTNGALTALEQMLSKGKVQAEEIRGQLGERLPGAFQILAESMNLTTAELDKQLEMGNVIADEVLPKFARQLEKTFSLENIDRVETLAAAQGRLSNSWNQFIRNIEEGNSVISGILSNTLDLITETISGWDKLINPEKVRQQEAYNQALEKENKFYENQIGNIEALAKLKKQSAENNIKRLEDEISLAEEYQRIEDQLNAGENVLPFNIEIFGDFLSDEEISKLKERKKEIQENINVQGDLNDSINNAKALIKGNEAVLFAANQQLGINTDKNKENNKELKQKGNLVKGTIDWFTQMISAVREQQNAVAANSKEWREYQIRIEQLQDGIARLKDEFDGLQSMGVVELIDTEADLKELQDYNDAQYNAIQKRLKDEQDYHDASYQMVYDKFQRIASLYNVDASKFANLYDQKTGKLKDFEENVGAYAEATGETLTGISNAIFQGTINRIQGQIQKNREYYDDLIDQARGNEKKQELLRQERDRKETELLRKEAQERKRAAIFESVINTAVAITKTLATLGFPAGIPAAAIIGGLGVAETAIIASQPLPQYKTGRKGGKEEYAILGDGYKSEAITDKKGNLKGYSPNKPTVMKLDEGDSVHPDARIFDIQRAAILASVSSSNEKLSNANTAKSFNSNLSKTVENGITKGLRKARFKNQNINNNKVELNHTLWLKQYS